MGLLSPARGSAVVPTVQKESADFTLYGEAAGGWGNSTTTLSNPGPTLYVYQGENVSITLFAGDNIPHNWFIDFNGNNRVDAGEVSSPDFSSSTNAVMFNFTVPTDRIGPYEYVCRYHTPTMRGQIVILTPPEITLYGSQVTGWGFTNNTTDKPGPVLYMRYGTNLTIHLISLDDPRVDHTWFVDYNRDESSTGEPSSALFNSTAPTTYVYTPDRSGNFTYRCSFHRTSMTGTIVILGNAPAPSGGFKIDLIPGIMVATIIAVLVLAAVYQVRAVRAARRHK